MDHIDGDDDDGDDVDVGGDEVDGDHIALYDHKDLRLSNFFFRSHQ